MVFPGLSGKWRLWGFEIFVLQRFIGDLRNVHLCVV